MKIDFVTRIASTRVLFAILMVLFAAPAVLGDQIERPTHPIGARPGVTTVQSQGPIDLQTYGIEDPIKQIIPGLAFSGEFTGIDGTFKDAVGTGAVQCSAGTCHLVAPLVIPTGAGLAGIEMDVCDTNVDFNISLDLWQRAALEAGTPLLLADPSTTGAPGCVRVTSLLASPATIDNASNVYSLHVVLGGAGGTTRLQAVRAIYKLQVSPAPGVATFSDVPTSHPFFQYVEALATSGITAGCSSSPLKFCPDAPLTRGQMAVFLAKALGLHFAP